MHKQHPQTAYRKYAVSLHDPSREKVNRENPRIFPIYFFTGGVVEGNGIFAICSLRMLLVH